MTVPYRPLGYHSVTPYLALRDAKAAIDFYTRAFGAELVLKLDLPDGAIAHAEIRIGDSILMLSEENDDWGARSPQSLGGSPVSMMIYVPDVDAAFARALEAGATRVRPVEDQFYGDAPERSPTPTATSGRWRRISRRCLPRRRSDGWRRCCRSRRASTVAADPGGPGSGDGEPRKGRRDVPELGKMAYQE